LIFIPEFIFVFSLFVFYPVALYCMEQKKAYGLSFHYFL